MGAAYIKTGGGQASLENQDLDLSYLQTAVSWFLSEYGWYLLILCGGVYLLSQHLIKNRPRRDNSSASVGSHDSTSVVRRQEALEAARQRMQADLDAKAAEFKEKQQINSDEAARSSTVLKPKTEKKSLRSSGYNPLSDGGRTCAWRPGRRGPSAGG